MLLRGCHKRMICVKSADSSLFCEAFFVLREDCREAGERDMLTEANRILEEHTLSRHRARRKERRLIPLLFSFLLGAALSTATCLLIALCLA